MTQDPQPLAATIEFAKAVGTYEQHDRSLQYSAEHVDELKFQLDKFATAYRTNQADKDATISKLQGTIERLKERLLIVGIVATVAAPLVGGVIAFLANQLFARIH